MRSHTSGKLTDHKCVTVLSWCTNLGQTKMNDFYTLGIYYCSTRTVPKSNLVIPCVSPTRLRGTTENPLVTTCLTRFSVQQCLSFLLGDRCPKDSPLLTKKKKQLTLTYCEGVYSKQSSRILRHFSEMISIIFSQVCRRAVRLTTDSQQKTPQSQKNQTKSHTFDLRELKGGTCVTYYSLKFLTA